ncbi:ankyrin repeat and BTB/POZ domain-containing protein 1-like isoform X2 [Uloborus diversus]|uniref:ankyrin repeat and BTB/POZ domain-containing protein 1-like isoform X2 n=1 Tax=Uloborus diversus TaxID=327109 RepID=UPI002409249E|nr:ankyrin repeat and BTB/POZ domain-containing protein 1-like isoform X2 [Uloborus diversus]
MDKHELFSSCKKGDLSRVRYLVEQKDVELNVRDKWDGTPLYYACLCGHYKVVHYLLQNGAKCDANTFDGERCLYGALTRKIKNLLRNLKVVTSKIMSRDHYSEFLRRAFETAEISDVCFVIQGEKINAHSSILAARSEKFLNMLKENWKLRTEGVLDLDISDIEAFLHFINDFGFNNLVIEIEKRLKRKRKRTSFTIEFNQEFYKKDFYKLFLSALPKKYKEYNSMSDFDGAEFADLHIQLQDQVFACHKVFISGRCEYFKALLLDHFSEVEERAESKIHAIKLTDINPDLFIYILQYIYTNTVEINRDDVLDLLSLADMLILTGLKKQCSTLVGENLSVDNVVEILQVARLYNLPRLETQCTEYMAIHLEEVVQQPAFKSIVLQDANEIQERQETDTIAVIDDIRYHIASSTKICFSSRKFVLIESLLEELKLDA